MREMVTARRVDEFIHQQPVFGEKNRFLAGFTPVLINSAPETRTGPYGTFGMEPASLQ